MADVADNRGPRGDPRRDRRAVQAARLHLPVVGDLRRGRRRPTTTATTASCCKNNVKDEWWRAMVGERDDIVALDSAILQHPRVWEASGHLEGFTDPMVDCRTCKLRFRADKLEDAQCGRKPSKHPGEFSECDLTDGARVQPHVRDPRRAGEGHGVDRLPAPRDRAGDLHQLQERPPVRAQEAAVRDRADRQVVSQRDHDRATSSSAPASSSRWRWSTSSRPTRRRSGTEYWMGERMRWYTDLGIRPGQPASSARTRRRRALALLLGDLRRRVPVPDGLVGARGDREPRRLRPDPARRTRRARSSSTSTRRRARPTSRT